MKNITNIVLAVAIIAVAASLIIKPKTSDVNQVSQTETQKESPMPVNSPKSMSKPEMIIDPQKSYTATLHTDEGDITISLDAKGTPITANNFYYLAKNNFYDGVIFHRVIPGFMIQGGDPTGTGSGGPGYRFDDEPFTGEYTRGTVAMANAGPDTNGSQFFIMHADYNLPKNYVIFGKVTAGLDVIDKIATAKTVQDGRENSTPETPVKISRITLDEK